MAHQRDARAEDFVGFADALEPLQQADKLGCVLAQFPYSFHANSQNVDYLRRFRELLPALPVVVEFRNRQWITKKTFEFLRGLDFGFCCVHQPRFDSLVPPVTRILLEIAGSPHLHATPPTNPPLPRHTRLHPQFVHRAGQLWGGGADGGRG